MRIARFAALLLLPLAVAACKPEDTSKMMEGDSSAAASVVVIDLETGTDAGTGDTMMDHGQSSATSTGAMMMDHAPASAQPAGGAGSAPAARAEAGTYAAFEKGVLADGQTKVLFFHAEWCPICRAQETELLTWYETKAQQFLTTYKLDYDAEKDLKATYGVTYQHTFVKVDGQGKLIEKIQGPTDDQLTALLTR